MLSLYKLFLPMWSFESQMKYIFFQQAFLDPSGPQGSPGSPMSLCGCCHCALPLIHYFEPACRGTAPYSLPGGRYDMAGDL